MSAWFTRREMFSVALTLVCVPACAKDDSPSEPVWGKEPCAYCKMLVSDRRFAAQSIDESGEHRFFDDIGCLVLWLDVHARSSHSWAYASPSGPWVEAEKARYQPGARTPMDFGFVVGAVDSVDFSAVREAVLAKKRAAR